MHRTIGRGRVAYSDAGKAGRAVIDAALGAKPELRAGEWRVLCVLIEYTALYSKITDRLTLGRIAHCAHRSPRQVRRHLLRLQDRGLIRYEPGRGRRISRISLADSNGASHVTPHNRTIESSPHGADEELDDPSGVTSTTTPAPDICDDPSTEKLNKKKIEKTAGVSTTNGETAPPEWGPGREEYAAKMRELKEKRAKAARGQNASDTPPSARDAFTDYAEQLVTDAGTDIIDRDATESEAS